MELADHEEATDIQKSRALAEAAACARMSGDDEKAAELAGRIPVESIAGIAQMEMLSGQRDWEAIVEQFGGEDLRQWPFTEIGAAALARGRAFSGANLGDRADADFQLALEFVSNSRTQTSLLSAMARNRESVLKDDDLALETWRRIAASTTNTGSAEYFSGLQGAARILTKRREFDEAIQILDQVDADQLGGTWSPAIWLSRAETLAAAGRKAEALKAYRAVLKSESAHKAQRETAEAAIRLLEQ